ncbi:TniB family NTP-binding protein [Pseudomonas chlororaphis]|nr:TniB family NTP-binding protein [Pseudomonas chlororaphis]MDO1504926.1 AAA family ATPase [Pseudomonas chlororaphis]ORM44922.1 hypothetical protein B6D51_28475 [Pseudomonas chlororaphis subsp. chlororaphis]TWR96305.1 transposase [Pseudomonas chlororaphis subsp. chlororaphis]
MQNDKVWVDYPLAAKISDIVNNFCELPRRSQAPCMIVCGEGGTGKTSIINQLKRESRFKEKLIYVALNVNPYGYKFNELIADALGVPCKSTRGVGRKSDSLMVELEEVIRLRNIRGIVIDELHDAMLVPRLEQGKHLSLLKGLSNAPFGLSVVGFGTNSAGNALAADKQLSRRFIKFQLTDWSETEGFRSFLAGLEEMLPLKYSSGLDREEIVGLLLSSTLGRMDDVVKLIRSTACYAIRTGEEKITPELLNKTITSPWGY